MKENVKEIIALIIILILLSVSAFSQNQFADYVNYNKSLVDGDYMYVLVDNKPVLVQLNNTQLTPLSSFVMRWYGVKYRLGGSTKKGIDCSQFTKKLYWEVYGRKLGENCAAQWKQTKRVVKDSLKTGDIVFFRSRQSPSGWHCGLYLGNGTFVHAANKEEGVKVSSLLEPRYLRGYKGAGRLD